MGRTYVFFVLSLFSGLPVDPTHHSHSSVTSATMFKQRQYKPLACLCDHKLVDGRRCNRGFQNRSGLTQHVNMKHHTINDENMASGRALPDDTAGARPPPADHTINKHPLLDGKYFKFCFVTAITILCCQGLLAII